jgi:hypothetical protein
MCDGQNPFLRRVSLVLHGESLWDEVQRTRDGGRVDDPAPVVAVLALFESVLALVDDGVTGQVLHVGAPPCAVVQGAPYWICPL